MDRPFLTKFTETEGPDEAIIIIKGYLSDGTEPEEVSDDYTQRLRNAGWRGSVYHLWWDASNTGGVASKTTTGALLTTALSAPLMGPIAIGSILGARYHWAKVKDRAKRTGQDHGLDIIRSNVSEHRISLLGHSLGARVSYYLLRRAAEKKFQFENAYLLGGAVRRDSSKDWSGVTNGVRRHIVNVYNKKDKVLSSFYRLAEVRQNPCGRKPIKVKHSKIKNINARYIINSSSHGAYRKFLTQTIGAYFHQT